MLPIFILATFPANIKVCLAKAMFVSDANRKEDRQHQMIRIREQLPIQCVTCNGYPVNGDAVMRPTSGFYLTNSNELCLDSPIVLHHSLISADTALWAWSHARNATRLIFSFALYPFPMAHLFIVADYGGRRQLCRYLGSRQTRSTRCVCVGFSVQKVQSWCQSQSSFSHWPCDGQSHQLCVELGAQCNSTKNLGINRNQFLGILWTCNRWVSRMGIYMCCYGDATNCLLCLARFSIAFLLLVTGRTALESRFQEQHTYKAWLVCPAAELH